jgi:predicted phosphodiesterase
MKIQIASDLHLERRHTNQLFRDDNPIKPEGDVLILAGDICNLCSRDYTNFFTEWCKDNFEHVIHIPGNHEYYGSSYISEDKFLDQQDNYIFCNNENIVIDGVRFLCTTLWSGVSQDTTKYLCDYYEIKNFHQVDENIAHQTAKRFLQTNLSSEFDGPTIVVTHHLPLWECIDEQYKGNSINDAFASNQDGVFDHKIDYWVHGHSHSYQCFTHKDTVVIRNPYGYNYNEQSSFITNCVIDV